MRTPYERLSDKIFEFKKKNQTSPKTIELGKEMFDKIKTMVYNKQIDSNTFIWNGIVCKLVERLSKDSINLM